MDKISIIVPVYHVEKYLDRCVSSIVNQTYENLEIILVDDESPDGCPKKCDDWAKKDDRIKVVHKKNGGVSSARNAGLNIASGKYVGFVDADDYIDLHMYEIMESNMNKNNADIVICANHVVGKNDTILSSVSYGNKIVETEYGVVPFATGEKFEVCCVWNKLYKLSVIKTENIYFDERFHVGEDFLFNYYYLKYTEKVVVIDDLLYNYVNERDDSATGSLNPDFIHRWMVYKIILENEKSDCQIYNHCLHVYYHQLLTCLKQLISSGNKDFIDNHYPAILSEIRAYYPEFKKLETLSHVKRFIVSFIKTFPNVFKTLYMLYFKFKNGEKT